MSKKQMSAWDQIAEAAQQGLNVSVNLTPGAQLKRVKEPTPGRPKTRGAVPHGHYAGYDESKGSRPRCRRQGCSKYLRLDQSFACSDACHAALVAAANRVMKHAAS